MTGSVQIGLSVAARHPMLAAMEIAALTDAFPGRLTAGIGVGDVPHLQQLGLRQSARVSGNADDCTAAVVRLADAGVSEVILVRFPESSFTSKIEVAGRDVVPDLPHVAAAHQASHDRR